MIPIRTETLPLSNRNEAERVQFSSQVINYVTCQQLHDQYDCNQKWNVSSGEASSFFPRKSWKSCFLHHCWSKSVLLLSSDFRPCSCFSTFHRIVGQFRLEGHQEVIWSILLCKAGLIRVDCSDSPPVTLQTHPRLETLVPVWAVCSSSSWRKQILQASHWNSQRPTCAHCLWS